MKRDAIDLLLGSPVSAVGGRGTAPILAAYDATEGDATLRRGQIPANLLKLREEVVEEIARIEKTARGNRSVAVGQITRTAPIQRDDELPLTIDPNNREYRGDPYLTSNLRGQR